MVQYRKGMDSSTPTKTATTSLFTYRGSNSGLTGLNEGQRVSYELAEQRNGRFAAVDLSIVGDRLR